jgi:hypothetical protein
VAKEASLDAISDTAEESIGKTAKLLLEALLPIDEVSGIKKIWGLKFFTASLRFMFNIGVC